MSDLEDLCLAMPSPARRTSANGAKEFEKYLDAEGRVEASTGQLLVGRLFYLHQHRLLFA